MGRRDLKFKPLKLRRIHLRSEVPPKFGCKYKLMCGQKLKPRPRCSYNKAGFQEHGQIRLDFLILIT